MTLSLDCLVDGGGGFDCLVDYLFKLLDQTSPGVFEIYDFIFELNFFGFFVCLFPNKILGFAGLFAWEEHKVHVLKRTNECSYEKKSKKNN